jgi:hypothetical protein
MPLPQGERPVHVDAWQAFCERVACEDRLHLKLEPLPVRDGGLEPDDERNLHVLNTLASLEERRAESAEDAGPLMQELVRLDSKLNVLMEVVNRLLVPDSALPARQPVRFNACGAVLPAALLAPPAEAYALGIHFDACRALPLVLPARLARRLDDGQAFLAFEVAQPAVAEGLERLVFRQHRRKVAGARQAPAA